MRVQKYRTGYKKKIFQRNLFQYGTSYEYGFVKHNCSLMIHKQYSIRISEETISGSRGAELDIHGAIRYVMVKFRMKMFEE